MRPWAHRLTANATTLLAVITAPLAGTTALLASITAPLLVGAIPAVAASASAAAAEACSGTSGVTVVVDFRSLAGGAAVRCSPGDPASGLAALSGAGFGYSFVPRQPGLVCQINGQPDPCNGAPTNAYWSYWHAQPGGSWIYSSLGAGSYNPAPGSVEGWSFGAGQPPGIAPPAAAAPPPPPPPPPPAQPQPSQPPPAKPTPRTSAVSTARPPANQPAPPERPETETTSAQPPSTSQPEPASATVSSELPTSTSQPDNKPVAKADPMDPADIAGAAGLLAAVALITAIAALAIRKSHTRRSPPDAPDQS
jgi:hypothetical protein